MANDSPDALLCVFGATGQQGGAVLRHYAKQQDSPKIKLRGITRNTDSEAARGLRRLGVEMVAADLNVVDSIKHALLGVTHVFATTDSNQTIFNAIKKPETLPEGHTPRSFAYEQELQQAKNILEAASNSPTISNFVWSSLASPKKWSNGRYSQVSMWDAKEDIADMFHASPALQDKLRVLILGFFLTNALNVPDLYAPQKTEHGIYELALPMSGETPVPMADLEADAGRWVEALFSASPGTKLVGSSGLVTWSRWLGLWGEINDVPVRYRRAGREEFGNKVEGISEAVLEEFQFIDEFGFVGGDPKPIYPEQLNQQGIRFELSDLKQLMRSQDWSPLLH